jgi:peptidoglycan pentaglycine glycine transferase (the second and third glycine)
MKFVELTETEFSKWAVNHPLATFFQTIEWGKLKAGNGWHIHLVGVKEDEHILAACIMQSKLMLIGKMFYAPRGFLIDYDNKKLLTYFTKEIKKYVKKQGGIFLKIDPNVIHCPRDIDGKIIEDAKCNNDVINSLIKLGYKYLGFNWELGKTLQPRWNFVLNLENKTEEQLLKEMDQQTRWSVNKTLKLPFEVRELGINDIEQYKDIMQHTSERRDFIDRPLEYYKNMYRELSPSNMMKLLVVELNVKEYIAYLDTNLDIELANKKVVEEKLESTPNNGKLLNKLKVAEEAISNYETKLEETRKWELSNRDKIIMAGALFITYANEITYLFSGAYREYMNFNAQYRIQWEMIKYGLSNGYKRYNFGGISGHFDKDDPIYGIYAFKRGFNGNVEELIGEFDLIVNKLYYGIYTISFKLYKVLKKLLKRG